MGTSQATITFTLPTPQTFDHVMIKEYVYDGQRIAGWDLEYYDAGTSAWKSLVSGKKAIGYKRIVKFNQVTSSRVRLNITRSWDAPEISDFALYKTLSGIDTTREDTLSIPTTVGPRGETRTLGPRPKIAVRDHRLAIDPSGTSIVRVEIASLDGRSAPFFVTPGSTMHLPRMTPGIYLVKVHTASGVFLEKIALTP